MNDDDRRAVRDSAFKGAFLAVTVAWIIQIVVVIFGMLVVLSDY